MASMMWVDGLGPWGRIMWWDLTDHPGDPNVLALPGPKFRMDLKMNLVELGGTVDGTCGGAQRTTQMIKASPRMSAPSLKF